MHCLQGKAHDSIKKKMKLWCGSDGEKEMFTRKDTSDVDVGQIGMERAREVELHHTRTACTIIESCHYSRYLRYWVPSIPA